jgi:hypothetical protein
VQWIDPLGLIKLGYDKSKKTWSTPNGLSYGQGSVHGNRVKHVLDHETPNASKSKHSVFCGCKRGDSLDVVDEAWSKRGTSTRSGPNDVYEMDMGRQVGAQGESRLRVVTKAGTNEVDTAYPVQ